MKIKVIGKTDEEIRFVVEDTNPQFVNALRRIMIGEIPILAIDSVDFYDNDSPLYDEVVSHRLGLVPLKFDSKAFTLKDKCKCDGKGCSNCEIILVMDKKKPGLIYSGDMKSADSKTAEPLYSNIIILKLYEDQKFKVEAHASLGFGKDHIKFQAANAYYRYYPSAKLNGKISNSDEVTKVCPKKALRFDGNKVFLTIDCDLCKECLKHAKPKGALEINGDPSKFIFTVESTSGLKADDIVLKALDILKKKASDLGKEIGKIK